jgi:L-asparaginase
MSKRSLRTNSSTKNGSSKRRVLVINVGGTLGMKKNSKGSLAPCSGYLTEQMHSMPELRHPAMPSWETVEFPVLLDSSDMVPSDWIKIAREIEKHYEDFDGFVVAHGTDTMHYTACALSFMLHNLNKPVILTGGMVTLAEAYNDARRNLLVSILLASRAEELCEVCIFSNDVLLRGNRSIKVRHTMRAFESPNYPTLAIHTAQGFRLQQDILLRQPSGRFSVNSDMSGRVMIFLLHPEFDEEVFERLLVSDKSPAGNVVSTLSGAPELALSPGNRNSTEEDGKEEQQGLLTTSSDKKLSSQVLDCVVLELMGVGAVSSQVTASVKRIVDTATQVGTIVVATTQDLKGQLTAAGVQRLHRVCPEVVFVDDMTTEAAAVKAMYLFGLGMAAASVKRWMGTCIRGEMSSDVRISKI